MPKIMIVDDSSFIRNHYSKVLADHGYEIVVAQNGEQAIELYRTARPDVVLMDIVMPRMDGISALNRIRALDPAAKVIVLTAMDQKSATTRAIQAGAKDFMLKPVLPSQLLIKLERLLKRT